MPKLTIRLDFDTGASLGPGKIRLLEAIRDSGSIRKAAAEVGMSFRQAWLLLADIDAMFGEPAIKTLRGGAKGGGSALTGLGELAVASYRSLEKSADAAAQPEIVALAARIRASGARSSAPAVLRRRKSLKKK